MGADGGHANNFPNKIQQAKLHTIIEALEYSVVIDKVVKSGFFKRTQNRKIK
jgi:hypothetical protein